MSSTIRAKVVLVTCSIGGLIGLLLGARTDYVTNGRTPDMIKVSILCLVVALSAQGWAAVIGRSAKE